MIIYTEIQGNDTKRCCNKSKMTVLLEISKIEFVYMLKRLSCFLFIQISQCEKVENICVIQKHKISVEEASASEYG